MLSQNNLAKDSQTIIEQVRPRVPDPWRCPSKGQSGLKASRPSLSSEIAAEPLPAGRMSRYLNLHKIIQTILDASIFGHLFEVWLIILNIMTCLPLPRTHPVLVNHQQFGRRPTIGGLCYNNHHKLILWYCGQCGKPFHPFRSL